MARTFAPHVVTPDSALGGKKIEKSLTFDENNQTTLICNLGSSGDATNRKKTTLSFWIKLLRPEQGRGVITAAASGTGASATGTRFHLNSDGTWKFATQVSNSTVWAIDSTIQYNDVNSWYHVVMQLDTTQSTSSDRVKIYVNGTQDTTFSGSYPSQNYDDYWSFGNWRIGDYGGDYGYYYGARFMIADIYLLDGQSLDPTYFAFTETQTGIWTPKDYTGTFGDHGFHLEFKDDSAATATTMGKDTSGNANNFTPSNFSASGDGKSIKSDTPTNNKTTIDGLLNWTYDANGSTLREGNLKLTGSQGWKNISTFKIDGTEKLYYEFVTNPMAGWQLLGILVITKGDLRNLSSQLTDSRVYGFASTQATYFGGSYTSTSDVPSWTNNDVMSIKYEKGILRLYKNGTLATATATGIDQTKEIYAYIANDNASTPTGYVRFDKDSWTQSSNAGVDYTWQLSEGRSIGVKPTVLRPQRHFDTLTYTGDGSTNHLITGLEFQPDLVWIKSRSQGSSNHGIHDSLRKDSGNTTILYTNSTAVENAGGSYMLSQNGFVSNGIRVNNNISGNNNGETYVAWCWKAGGAAVTNNDGSGTSQVSVNKEAGFSIVTYSGNATGSATSAVWQTIGHGLGKTPKWIVFKSRSYGDADTHWANYHVGVTDANTDYVVWDTTEARIETDVNYMGSTLPTSSVFSLGYNYTTNKNGEDYVAYCWAEIPGFSKFGRYKGTGNSNGSFINVGFKPAWVLVKGEDFAGNWNLWDIKRPGANPINDILYPNLSNAEYDGSPTDNQIDIYSNGFKLRGSNVDTNSAGNTYIYMAFAEQTSLNQFNLAVNGF